MRAGVVRVSGLLLAGLALCGCRSSGDGVDRPPGRDARGLNVVLILADDLGIGDLGAFNPGSKIPTPNLDRLAASGVRFTDAHSPSAVCTPTRYGILTGRYAWRTRLKSWVLNGSSRALIEPGRATIATALRGEGYRTAAVGKWHLGLGAYDPADPDARTDYSSAIEGGAESAGFESSDLIPASLDMPPYVWVVDGEVEDPALVDDPGSRRRWDGGGGFWRAGERSASLEMEGVLPEIGRRARVHLRVGAMLQDWAPEPLEPGPFFVYVPLTAPHTPWVPTEEFQGTSDAGWYGDFVAQVDHVVGQILDELERGGVADDTVVIFASDNGAHWRERDEAEYGHLANLGYRGMKADAYEGGHRIPLIVRWPGVTEAGGVCDATVGLNDLFATLADGLGVGLEPAAAPDSESFMPALRGGPYTRREPQVLHSGAGVFVIRDGDWKLIDGLGSGGFTVPRRVEPEPGGPSGQLYNLRDDPGEETNLWLDRPEVVGRLKRELDRIRDAGR